MKTLELLEVLDKMNPTDEQLALCMELRKNIFPLPLYVKLPNGDHLLTRKLENCMTVEGIATERGIYLNTIIQPIRLGLESTIADLYAAAKKVHPDARPIIEDDIFGEGKNNLSSFIYENSILGITIHRLNRSILDHNHCVELCNYNADCYAIPNTASLSDRHIILYNLYNISYRHNVKRKIPINEVARLGLFIPAEEIVTNSLKENFAEQIDKLKQHETLFVHPPRPKESEKFPLYLYLRNPEGKYFVSNQMPVPDGLEIEGIVIGDRAILRQTIEPRKITEPTVKKLTQTAKQLLPQAEPLHFGGHPLQELTMMLFLFKEKYNKTAELLRKHGVEMPTLDGDIAYIAGGDALLDSPANRVDIFSTNSGKNGKIGLCQLEKILLIVPLDHNY